MGRLSSIPSACTRAVLSASLGTILFCNKDFKVSFYTPLTSPTCHRSGVHLAVGNSTLNLLWCTNVLYFLFIQLLKTFQQFIICPNKVSSIIAVHVYSLLSPTPRNEPLQSHNKMIHWLFGYQFKMASSSSHANKQTTVHFNFTATLLNYHRTKEINPSVPEYYSRFKSTLRHVSHLLLLGFYCLTITVIALKFHATYSWTTMDDPILLSHLIQQMFDCRRWW